MCISSLEQSVLTPGLDLQEVQRRSQRLLFSSVWSLLIQRIPLMVMCFAVLYSRVCATPLFTVKMLHCTASYRAKPRVSLLLVQLFWDVYPDQDLPRKFTAHCKFFGGGHTLDFTVLQQSFVWIHRNPYCNMYSKLLAMHCVLVAF